jgi:hypothetical protein
VGVVVYQVTAPATPASGGFSLSNLIAKIRSEIHGQDVQIPVVRAATAPAPASIKTLRLGELRATVTLLGEAREDVAAELRATAFGADQAQAKVFEQAFQLELVPDGDVLELRVKSAGQEMRRRRIELTIRVPQRLELELALLGGELKVSHVARVTFERGGGRSVLSDIAGGVEGEYGPGALEIDSAGPVKLETDRTELRVSRITGSVELQAKGNELRVREVAGPTTLSLERVEAEAEDLHGAVKVEGEGGEIRLRDVRAPVEVKGHRLTLRLTL